MRTLVGDAALVEKEAYFAEVLRYVVLNRVRAKLVERPEEYRWSSDRATAGLEPAPPWLDVSIALAWLGSEQPLAQEQSRVRRGEDRLHRAPVGHGHECHLSQH